MIWAGIIGGIMVGPWRVPDGTKITADAYIAFLKEHLESWLKSKESPSGEPSYLCKIMLLCIQRRKIRGTSKN